MAASVKIKLSIHKIDIYVSKMNDFKKKITKKKLLFLSANNSKFSLEIKLLYKFGCIFISIKIY